MLKAFKNISGRLFVPIFHNNSDNYSKNLLINWKQWNFLLSIFLYLVNNRLLWINSFTYLVLNNAKRACFSVFVSLSHYIIRWRLSWITGMSFLQPQLRRDNSLYWSSRSRVFYKIGVLKNFALFAEKHLCWSLFFIKFQA